MFLTSTMSVLGLYQVDQTIFDLLRLPDGIDRNTLVHSILLESANREVLYPDPAVLKNAIGLWAERSFLTWQKLLYTTTVEYDPISNYDRTESWTEQTNDSRESEEIGTSNTIQNQTNSSVGNVNGVDDGSSTRQVKAFNDTALSDAEKTITNLTTKRDTSDQTNIKLDGSAIDGRTVVDSSSGSHTRTGHTSGNIGVTTTQQMIEAEREVVQFNIYDFIVKSFCDKFVLGVW